MASRIPQPQTTDIKKHGVTGYTTRIVQATLGTATGIPRAAIKHPKSSLQAPRPDAVVVYNRREALIAPGYQTDDEIRFGILCSLNPNVDRSAAVAGHEDASKLLIVLFKPPFGTAGQPLTLKYPNEVHWSREGSIRGLNRWRAAIFRHYLGLELQQTSDWHPMEQEFVMEAFKVRLEQARTKPFAANKTADGYLRPYSWVAITHDFNSCFAGRKLPGCETPKSARKRTELISQYFHMQKEAEPFRSTVGDGQNKPSYRRSGPSPSPSISSIPKPQALFASRELIRPRSVTSSIPRAIQRRSGTSV